MVMEAKRKVCSFEVIEYRQDKGSKANGEVLMENEICELVNLVQAGHPVTLRNTD
jgi:hypothetical protein